MGDTDKAARRKGDIDTHLRRAFQELEQEEVPDRLLGLLDQLRAGDPAKAGDGHDSGGQRSETSGEDDAE